MAYLSLAAGAGIGPGWSAALGWNILPGSPRKSSGLYKLLLREPGVCRVDVLALVALDKEKLGNASPVIEARDECKPGAPKRRPGAPKPFCMNCGRDL